MDLETVDICSICLDAYDCNVRPRCLPCGHSFCTSCITNSISDGRILCPHCQKPHRAFSAKNFPISYSMEAVIIELRKAKLGVDPKTQTGDSKKESFPSVSSDSKWQAVFNEEKDTLRKIIEACKETKSEMLDYEAFLGKRKAEHEELIPKIYKLVKRNEAVVKKIAEEENMLAEALKEGDELRKKANDTLQKFDDAESIKDILTGSEEVERSRKSLSGWRRSSQKQLPSVKTIRCSEKIVRETTLGLSLMNADDKYDAELTDVDMVTSLPIMRKVNITRGGTDISVGELRSNEPYIRSRLNKGLVYAVQSKDGRIRSAKILQMNERTYLYHLQDASPPSNAFTVKHNELLDSLNPNAQMTFMDLSWDGSVRGRLHILLSPNTPLAHHFKILCSGECGPSYANTSLLNVNYKGTNDEQVSGGDYERSDGTGGAPLFKGIDPSDKIYRRRSNEGIVWTRYGVVDGPRIAQFAINTRNNSNSDYLRVFGQVQDGLEILREAVNLPNITKVKIAECGIVLSF